MSDRTVIQRIAIGVSAVALVAVMLYSTGSDEPLSDVPQAFSESMGAPGRASAEGYPPAVIDERPSLPTTAKTVELCGYGQIEVRRDELYPPQVQATARNTLIRATDSLASDPDPGMRAIGAYLAASMKAVAVVEKARATLPPDCEESPDCSRRLHETSRPLLQRHADQLAAGVVSTRDGRAYAISLSLCERAYGLRPAGQCARLSATHWASLEPDNVVPWLAAASQAQASGDRSAMQAAMRGAAAATSSRLYWSAPTVVADHPELAKAPPAVRLAALTDLLMVQAGYLSPSLFGSVQHCAKGVANDEARQGECSAIAEALLTGSTLAELSIGTAVGRNAGWPEDKVRSLQDRVDALKQMAPAWVADDLWTCAFLEKLEGYSIGVARYGEVGAAEEAVKQSGKTPSELAAQWRAHLAALHKEFEKSQSTQR